MAQTTTPSVERLDCSPQTERPDAVVRLGLVLLATDLTTEREVARLLHPEGIVTHAARVAFENPTTPETLRQMGPRLLDTAALLSPVAPLAAVYYSCTAGTVALGETAVAAAIRMHLPDTPVVTPPGAALIAFAALGVRRVALLTPYLPETTRPMVGWFVEHGLEIVRAACLGMEDDRDMARLTTASIVEAAVAADDPAAEALFVSCTALPAISAVEEIERRIGKPVVTSNQAALWQLRGHAGVGGPLPGAGRLFRITATPAGT